MFNLVELFAGRRSIGRAAEKLGYYNCFSVDWKNYVGIDLVTDIEFLKPGDIPFIPDIAWASPDCTTYSIAGLRIHRNGVLPKSEQARKSDRVIQNVIKLFRYWKSVNPNFIYYVENPNGMLKKMPFMWDMKMYNIWYCQYGYKYAKPTNIWSNTKAWVPRPVCFNGNLNCHHEKAGRGKKEV